MTPQKIAEELGKNSLCICPHFVNDFLLKKLQLDFSNMKDQGLFKRAAIGHKDEEKIQNTIRRDEIYWLEKNESTPPQAELWGKIHQLKEEFNKTLYLGITNFEGHYAHYAAGGFYQKHFDAFHKENKRVVSFILYLNENWKSEDGGQLRIQKDSRFIDIDPCGGTLICFLSKELEHEVLLSHAKRISFVGWYRQN